MIPAQFLQALRPGGPWLLVAINPAPGEQITAETVTDSAGVERFCEAYRSWNLYYSLNPTTRALDKKAKREDIASVEYFHVDIDPRAGEDLEPERARIERLIAELPTGIPAPTVTVFSGGGYNLLWKLERPIPIAGDLAAAEDAKLYNLRLESLLGGDNCHNIDRILRLPGTTNWPNARKVKRGRVPTEARLVAFRPEMVYPVEQFQKAHLVAGVAVPKPKIQVSGNIRRLDEVELEKLPIEEWCRVLITLGRDPIDETKYPSRSEALFAVVCEMVRKDVSDEDIYAVITDPEWGISESVLEKGSGVERYALHQIERARVKAKDPELLGMNDEFAVIENIGGKVRVVRFVQDAVTGHPRAQRFVFEDFRKMLMNQHLEIRVGDKVKKVSRGDWWLSHPNRRQYEQMVFAPGREVDGALNLWRGFACEAVPPAPGEAGKHVRYLEHLRNNICRGNEDHYQYLIRWMARAVQMPDLPGYSAVVLRGGQGTGKGIAAREFGALFGPHFKHVSDASRVTGKHNLHLQDCVVLFADEAFFAGDKQHAAALKRIITESTLDIEAKYYDAEITPNYTHIIVASNDQWVVPAEMDDRRFFVLEVGDEQKQQAGYFRKMIEELNDGGRENLLFFLQSLDLGGFDVYAIPQTEALRDQKMRSLPPEYLWWYEKLERGAVLEEDAEWRREVPVDNLVTDASEFILALHRGNRGMTSTSLRKFLDHITGGRVRRSRGTRQVVQVRGEPIPKDKPYTFLLPSVEECRRLWDKEMRTETRWGAE